jgi:[ribosomal protein S5]-alanine N-acetyltransferase
MPAPPLQTANLELKLQSPDDVRAMIDGMSPSEKRELSADWLAQVQAATQSDPWVHGFAAMHRESGQVVGQGMFKGPPGDGVVEIAYAIQPDQQGRGYATEIARALVSYAFCFDAVQTVRAHTLPQPNASNRLLTNCGFTHLGAVFDPEDGWVWRFEKHRAE